MKNWKYIAFVSYKKIETAFAQLDFNYPIWIADKEMTGAFEYIKSIESETHNNDSEYYVEKEDKWHLCVEQTIIRLKDAIDEKSDVRRKEKYYGVINYITGFVELNDDNEDIV